MVATESAGLATKKSDSGIERPGVGPFCQVGPAESVRVAGTNTRYPPAASRYRYGRSRLTGLTGSVVYGGSGKDCAGAPWTPAKTWFQTAFDHGPMLESRTRNCCCDPLMMAPVTESARKPPLANCGPAVQKSMNVSVPPVTLTRRIGAACETAQKLPAARQPDSPATLMVRFDSDRQKLTRAM